MVPKGPHSKVDNTNPRNRRWWTFSWTFFILLYFLLNFIHSHSHYYSIIGFCYLFFLRKFFLQLFLKAPPFAGDEWGTTVMCLTSGSDGGFLGWNAGRVRRLLS